MIKFARLFEFKDGQILYKLWYKEESEEHNYTIDIEVQDSEVTYETRIGYKTRESRDKHFLKIDQIVAEEQIQKMIQSMGIS